MQLKILFFNYNVRGILGYVSDHELSPANLRYRRNFMFNFGSRQRISAKDAYENLQKDSSIIVLDVRTKQEFKGDGHIKKAINISVDMLNENTVSNLKDKDATIYVVCYSGSRSAMAVSIMKKLGYTNVYDLGGMISWPYDIVRG